MTIAEGLEKEGMLELTWKLWLFSRSTRLMAHSGNVKPLPLGPPPWVWPVKAEEVAVLAELTKLDGVVEKHM